jgi:ABC-type cobalamin/Fe3+-siderophores transport system ATPase subunit
MTQLPAGGELRITGLVVSYGANTALTGVTAAIPAGSVVGLIGPNGSGKSTLLKAVAGVARPGSGSITLGGCADRTPGRRSRVCPTA